MEFCKSCRRGETNTALQHSDSFVNVFHYCIYKFLPSFQLFRIEGGTAEFQYKSITNITWHIRTFALHGRFQFLV